MLRRPVIAAFAALASISSAVLVGPAASAATPVVVLSQDRASGTVGSTITVTATVTDGGNPVADNTFVDFSDPDVGSNAFVFARKVTTGLAIHGTGQGDGYWRLDISGHVET